MIDIEYKPEIREYSEAAMDFINTRPPAKMIMLTVKLGAFFIITSFCFKMLNDLLAPKDFLMLFLAVLFLIKLRAIHVYLLRKVLKVTKIDAANNKCQITKEKLCYQIKGKPAFQQSLAKLKYVYKNKYGYIIPITGMLNSGQFAWLPQRAFAVADDEDKFLQLMKAKGLKIKVLK